MVAAEILQVNEDDEIRPGATATMVPAAAEKDATVFDSFRSSSDRREADYNAMVTLIV